MNPGYFEHAHDFDIAALNTGIVININGNVCITAELAQLKYLEPLLRNVAVDAIHDARARSGAPKCYPATRVAVQDDITKWIGQEAGPNAERVLWVSGPAGAGKTAIAGSLAERWKEDKLLAASFFFSAFFGSAHCRSKDRFISTLVLQLIEHESLRDLKTEVLSAIRRHPLIFEKDLKEQLEQLILGPLRKVGRTSSEGWPKAILIDGVDECDASEVGQPLPCQRASAHREILSTLYHAAIDESFPFLIVVVSRPDPTIDRFFEQQTDITKKIFLDNQYDPDSDITLFVEGKLDEIRDYFVLPRTWPENRGNVVRTLVRNASGQFVYVATAIRYIESGDPSHHPQVKLDRILNPEGQQHASPENPFAQLDKLYGCILRTSPQPVLAVRWLHAILELHGESGDSVTMVKAFLESKPGEMSFLLGNLSSLLGVTENTFQFFHKSLLDYLASARRSGDLHVDSNATLAFLRDRWLHTLKGRGPQVPLEDASKRGAFLQHYAGPLTMRYFLHSPSNGERYDPADVDWWIGIAQACPEHELCGRKIDRMQDIVHEGCHSFWCHPSCKTWRTALRNARPECRALFIGIGILSTMAFFLSRLKVFR